MLLSAVSVLVVAQSSSEVPEGLMNNPVFLKSRPPFSLCVSFHVTLPKSAEQVFLQFDFGELAKNLLASSLTKVTDILREMDVLPRSNINCDSFNIYRRKKFLPEFFLKI